MGGLFVGPPCQAQQRLFEFSQGSLISTRSLSRSSGQAFVHGSLRNHIEAEYFFFWQLLPSCPCLYLARLFSAFCVQFFNGADLRRFEPSTYPLAACAFLPLACFTELCSGRFCVQVKIYGYLSGSMRHGLRQADWTTSSPSM